MKKKILMVLAVIVLTGCQASYDPADHEFSVRPPELEDCSFYRIRSDIDSIIVVRCPNSSTTVSHTSGKSHKSITVIDSGE